MPCFSKGLGSKPKVVSSTVLSPVSGSAGFKSSVFLSSCAHADPLKPVSKTSKKSNWRIDKEPVNKPHFCRSFLPSSQRHATHLLRISSGELFCPSCAPWRGQWRSPACDSPFWPWLISLKEMNSADHASTFQSEQIGTQLAAEAMRRLLEYYAGQLSTT